mgnify:CR=1 FL=1
MKINLSNELIDSLYPILKSILDDRRKEISTSNEKVARHRKLGYKVFSFLNSYHNVYNYDRNDPLA